MACDIKIIIIILNLAEIWLPVVRFGQVSGGLARFGPGLVETLPNLARFEIWPNLPEPGQTCPRETLFLGLKVVLK